MKIFVKPDLSNNTIPIPVNSNFMNGGIDSIPSLYIDAIGGRKSLIMNATVNNSGFVA